MRLITYGSSPTTPQLIRKAAETFNCDLMQMYGVTETTIGWICFIRPEDNESGLNGEDHLLRSCGRPALHFDIEIHDDNGVL